MTPPAAKNVAPTRPPNSAGDELDGSPKYQVIRVQLIAASTPAKTTPRPGTPPGSLTSPSPTVAATPAPKWVPMKLPTAAMASATLGVRALVLTLVAIA